MKKHLGPLDTLMSTVPWKQCWRDEVMRPVFFNTKDGKLAGWLWPLGKM